MAQIERRIQNLERKSGTGSAIAMIFFKVPADMPEDDRLEASEDLANAHGVRVGDVIRSAYEGDGLPPPPEFLTGNEVAELFRYVAKHSSRIGCH